MLLRDQLLLFAAGAAAASVNAAAGGGTLLSFPSLLAAGLSPLAANATSTVGLVPGSVASVAAFWEELRREPAELLRVVIPSLSGGLLGGVLLLQLGGAVFDAVVPVLLVTAAALLACQPIVARMLVRSGPRRDRSPAARVAAVFLIAIYGGYFGAGQGILFLGAMGHLLARDFQRLNALKIVAALVANLISASVFIVAELWRPSGAVVWSAAAPLAAGALVGGYFGVRLVRRLPEWALRAVASAVGVGIAVYIIVKRH